jgi:PQQ enzyme repeat
MNRIFVLVVILSGQFTHAAEPAATACEPHGGITPICGFTAPEDIDALPDGGALIVGSLGRWGSTLGGGIKAYYPSDERIDTLYSSGAQHAAAAAADGSWGDPTCLAPPATFSAHGLHVSARDDGTFTLLVVNHSERESVEWFQLRRDASGRLAATWRGCVMIETPLWINDVAMFPGGGFVATHMMSHAEGATMLDRPPADGVKSGWVVTWQQQEGWQKIPGTDGALPNGVQVSRDGRVVYVDLYLENTVAAFDRTTGRELWRTPVAGAPDNLSITPSGKLLVTAHPVPLARIRDECLSQSLNLCELPFIIYSLDADTGAARELHAGGGEPIGGVTVAVESGGQIYLGAYAGNRIGRMPAR